MLLLLLLWKMMLQLMLMIIFFFFGCCLCLILKFMQEIIAELLELEGTLFSHAKHIHIQMYVCLMCSAITFQG